MSAKELSEAKANADRIKRMTLDERSTNNLTAKQEVGPVSATIRTVDGILYTFEKLESLDGDAKQVYASRKLSVSDKDGNVVVKTFGQLYDEYGSLMNDKTRTAFAKVSSSITQATLDFANSGKLSLPKDWFVELFESFDTGMSRDRIAHFYHDVVSPLSIGYSSFDVSDSQSYRNLVQFDSEIAKI